MGLNAKKRTMTLQEWKWKQEVGKRRAQNTNERKKKKITNPQKLCGKQSLCTVSAFTPTSTVLLALMAQGNEMLSKKN